MKTLKFQIKRTKPYRNDKETVEDWKLWDKWELSIPGSSGKNGLQVTLGHEAMRPRMGQKRYWENFLGALVRRNGHGRYEIVSCPNNTSGAILAKAWYSEVHGEWCGWVQRKGQPQIEMCNDFAERFAERFGEGEQWVRINMAESWVGRPKGKRAVKK